MTEPETISVRELIRRINVAIQGMSRANPNRVLFVQCGRALIELAARTNTPADAPVLEKIEETVQ